MILDFESNHDQPGIRNNFIREFFGLIDRVTFSLMKFMYMIFFNVATAEFFSNATIRSFYGRVQLILGVFMVFRLSIVVLQTLIDPEKINDKNEGFSAIIKRVVIGLLLLAALTPINVPNASNDFEIELNNNGLIFGTLYSLQNRILANNTIGRIVLGTADGNTSTNESPDSTEQTDIEGQRLSTMANVFTATIMRIFIRINLVDEEDRKDDNIANNENWMCDINNKVLNKYTQIDADPATLTSQSLLTTTCGNGKLKSAANWLFGTNIFYSSKARYAFNYIPILGSVVAIIMTIILLGFTVDIAVRAIKLSVLRLIAPIPIIAYMGPQSKDNNAFSNWTKAVIGTYLDLFIRLAIVFFVLFLIQDILVNGITINIGGGIVGAFSMIFIIIGLFIFAKQAPQFIKDVLGVKSFGSNIGLATIMGGLGSISGGGAGIASGALNAFREQTDAAAAGKQAPGVMDTWRQSADNMAKIRTGDKDAHGGPLGYLQDRLEYNKRNNVLGRYGMGNDDLALAKYNKDRAESDAEYAQANFDKVAAAYQAGDATQEEYNRAYAQNKEAQDRAASAKKAYDKIDKARAQLGAAPRIRDTAVETYRSAQAVRTGKQYFVYDGNSWQPINDVAPIADETTRRRYDEFVRDQPERFRSEDVAVNSLGQFADRDSNDRLVDEQYDRDARSFDGTGDDRLVSLPTGGGGGHPGGAP